MAQWVKNPTDSIISLAQWVKRSGIATDEAYRLQLQLRFIWSLAQEFPYAVGVAIIIIIIKTQSWWNKVMKMRVKIMK